MSLEESAYHEAGHACVFLSSGIPVDSVTIATSSGLAAHTILADPRVTDSNRLHFAISTVAGDAAVRKFKGEPPLKRLSITRSDGLKTDPAAPLEVIKNILNTKLEDHLGEKKGTHDIIKLIFIGRDMTEDKSESEILKKVNEIIIMTTDFVENLWPEIEAVSKMLLENESITGDEILARCPGLRDEYQRRRRDDET